MPEPAPTPCLSVVMPCYDEAERVERAIAAVLASPWTAEVVVVDDGSADDTATLAEKAAALDPRVRVLRQPCNLGKGAALRRGFREVTAPFVVVQDADLEYDPEDWDLLLPPLLSGDADVVYGSRFTAAGPHRVLYYWHSIGNRLLTTLSNMATNVNLTDMETCSKLFRREVLQSVDLVEDRFGFEPEVTAKIAQGGWRIYEVGISYRGRTYDEGKKIGWRDGVRALWCIARYSRAGARVAGAVVRPPAPDGSAEVDVPSADLEWVRELVALRLVGRVLEPRSALDIGDRADGHDSAILVNVLEHASNDVTVLNQVRDRLRPGGTVVCVVPAHAWLHSSYDDAVGRHRRYRSATLAEALGAAGFEIDELRYLNAPGAVAGLLATRVLRRGPVDPDGPLYQRTVLPLAKRLESGRPAPFGQTLVAVARRID